MQPLVCHLLQTESETLKQLALVNMQYSAYLIQNQATLNQVNFLIRQDQTTLNCLSLYFKNCGQFSQSIGLALPTIRKLSAFHNCKEVFEHMLTEFEQDDKQIAVYTMHVFRHHCREFSELAMMSYLPKLLALDKMD